MPNTVTTKEGSANFPVNDNAAYGAVETIILQSIRSAKSANALEDAVATYDMQSDADTGKVIEKALIKKAQGTAFDKDAFDRAAADPTLYVKYFNNWDAKQYHTTTRKDEIRAIVANGAIDSQGVESISAEIIDSLTQGEGSDSFKATRNLLYTGGAINYANIIGGVPLNMDGVIYAIRNMYDHLISDNSDLTTVELETATRVEDVRIAIDTQLLNLIDVTKLANVFNLSKVELMGKIVPIRSSDLTNNENKYIVYAYDINAYGRATRVYDYEMERVAKGRYDNHYLTVERCLFHCGLFKSTYLDCGTAAAAELATLIGTTA